MLAYLLIAMIAAVLSFIGTKIVVLFHKLFIAPLNRNKHIKDKSYKTVRAELITHKASEDNDGIYHLIYKYEVNGKVYHAAVNCLLDYRPYITMYYLNDPKYAVDNINNLGVIENRKPIFTTVFLIIFVFIVLFWKLH